MNDQYVNNNTQTDPLITLHHNKKLLLLISVIFLTLLIAGAGGYFMWSKYMNEKQAGPAPKTEETTFNWPMSDRLTDKKWRELLSLENAPDLPEWTNEFISN